MAADRSLASWLRVVVALLPAYRQFRATPSADRRKPEVLQALALSVLGTLEEHNVTLSEIRQLATEGSALIELFTED